jgi:hypothetical protein
MRQEEEIKNIQIGKKVVKLTLFKDDMILCFKDPKNSTQKLLDNISSFSKVAEYKINLQTRVAFLYTKNEQIEKEYRKTIPFTITSKKIKYLVLNLTKEVNKNYKDNYKPLKKEIKGSYRRWKDLPYSWIIRINIVKMAILPKTTCSMQFPSKSK